jgi:AcrR family transcriptional regulator
MTSTGKPSDAESAPSRVARRRSHARERLVLGGAEIIAAKGTENLRLREIADRADIGFGSFYSHFRTKDELIAAVAEHTVRSRIAPVLSRAVQSSDPAESASISHRWFIRLASTDPQAARLIVNLDRADVMLATAIHDEARDTLQRGIDAGRFRPLHIEPTLVFVVGATIAVMRGILEGRLPATVDVQSAEAFLTTLGVTPDEAREIARRTYPTDIATGVAAPYRPERATRAN